MSLDISNIIDVSVVNVPVGLNAFNVNNVVLFTNDTPNNNDAYRYYTDTKSVIADYGTNSLTAQMVNSFFSQTPNPLSAGGLLTIVPLNHAVSATHGSLLTADISGKVSTFKAITNGSFSLTLNGVTVPVNGLNFSNVNTVTGIIGVLQKAMPDVFVTLVSDGNDSDDYSKILFTSKKVGSISTVVFAMGGTGTDITGSSYLHTSTGISTTGADASGETIAQAINRVSSQTFFVGILDTLEVEDTVIESTATTVQAMDKIYLHGTSAISDIAGLATTISEASNTKTRLLLHTSSVLNAQLFSAAYAARAFSVDFTGSNTALTMNLKPLKTISPDVGISETLYQQAKTAGIDLYVSYGVVGVLSTSGNDYFDNVYNEIWLKLALQVAGFNYLAQTITKIPQTETGMVGFKNALTQVMEQTVTNGVAAKGLTWNSSDTFGDPATLQRNITENGYYIYSQPVALQNQTLRNERIAPPVQIATKFSGAIQSAKVFNIVEY